MHLDGATAFGAVIVALFAWALWQSRTFGPRAGLLPWAVGAPGLLLGLVQLTRDLSGRREQRQTDDLGPEVPAEVARRRSIEVCVWIAAFWVGIWLLGFSLATLVMTLLYLKISARERWPSSVVLSVFGFLFVYGLFEKALGVPFPAGQLLVWLGLAADCQGLGRPLVFCSCRTGSPASGRSSSSSPVPSL